ncbi:MAG: hypothetical protein PUF66_00880 [Clostridium sp.]|nr:hypothetical protein [Clostridium sp.]
MKDNELEKEGFIKYNTGITYTKNNDRETDITLYANESNQIEAIEYDTKFFIKKFSDDVDFVNSYYDQLISELNKYREEHLELIKKGII